MRLHAPVAVLLVALGAAGCGRSSLIGFDNGCPPNMPNCGPLDFGGPDLGMNDGFNFDLPPHFDMPNFDLPPADAKFDMKKDGFIVLDGFIPDGGCQTIENCDNQVDDTCDGLTDCQDPQCQMLPVCINQLKEQCTNGVDDDNNGLIDCKDPACFGHPACFVPGQEICNNKLDDDDDGLIDCADPDCMGSPACKPNMGMEICDNGIDDNGDNLVDCTDPQCVNFPACLTALCQPEVDFGTIQAHDSSSTRNINTQGAVLSFATCAAPGGTARVGQFTLAATADVRIDVSQQTGAAHVVTINRAGVGQACDQNLVTCIQLGQMPSATKTLPALAPGVYWVIVQSFTGTQGPTTVKISTGPAATPEICNNGVDDDGNGLIDCADLACKTNPLCTTSQCNPDINLGALIVDGPSKNAVAVTTNGSNRFHPTCAGLSTGKDVTVSFSIPETAGILVQWSQTGDHAFGLFAFPPPGSACDAVQVSCYYPGGAGGGAVAFSPKPAGKYVFVFKAIGPGSEGTLNLRISAFKNHQVEICNNGIDDDGNGLIDCMDPACTGIGNCTAPICMPDLNVGNFMIGSMASATLNTQTGMDLYKTTCGKGNGKERVVRLNITQPMALGFSCTQTGSHVLQLAQQLQPLDACDAHNFNCADPAILPFGCNFAMPSIQPGQYNVIVEAFQSGQEGTVNLQLFGIQQNVLEICNNNIDDDMDGATDCGDLKCVTSPLCAKFQCRADQDMGLIPLNNTPVDRVVQTTGAGNDQMTTPCAAAPGGGNDAVVDFELPAKADLTLSWVQFGNHVFAIYRNSSSLLACDGGPLASCSATMNAGSGSVMLSGLAKGKYHMVVDATQPGAEGSVGVRLTGTIAP